MTEYILLTGVALFICLALAAAMFAFSATAKDDATAIAASRVASVISSSAVEAAGSGDTSAILAIDLPVRICGMPYVAYPWPDGHGIMICLGTGRSMQKYSVPAVFRAPNVSLAGFITGPPGDHIVSFDARTRTVMLI